MILAAVGLLLGAMGAMANADDEANRSPALQFGDQQGCPCLSLEEVQKLTGLVRMDGQDCLDFNQNSCYPPSYGAATCRAWDRGKSSLAYCQCTPRQALSGVSHRL